MPYPTYPTIFKKDILVGDKKIAIEIGHYSEQVTAVMVKLGETSVHTTVALGRKVNLGYFPLSVEFAEKLYAAGIIKGSRWVKRDGRPTDDVILKARAVDRSLRPMFPDGMTNEVQIINTVFSYDGENDPDMLGLLGSCLGVMISEIPFDGPLAGLRIGYSKTTQAFVVNPTMTERKSLDLDMIVSGNGKTIVMVEAGANEVSEAVVVEAMMKSQAIFAEICPAMEAIVKEVGKAKVELIEKDEAQAARQTDLKAAIKKNYAEQIHQLVINDKGGESVDTSVLSGEIAEKLNKGKAEAEAYTTGEIGEALYKSTKDHARSMIIDEKVRPDGRKTDEIRPIWCEVDVFARPHGSAMFKRGMTQVVTITTLGAPSLGQYIEGIDGEAVRHYMHHYNMPPYASGEAGRFGAPKRREIGHGALAERALLPMIPTQEEFPYAIHVVSEVMSSNGSTSQASVCGSTMSLMAAGVPIKRPVAGIAMGLISDDKSFVVLSDIQGLEDHVGDMDFKVAGTSEGITAIQMDIKLKGIPRPVLEQALEQAKAGRSHIMGLMLGAIAEPRKQLSQYAPKIEQITIQIDQIGGLIGPGGKIIKAMIKDYGAQIDIEEDAEKGVGMVYVSSPDQASIDRAVAAIKGMTQEVAENDEFDGTVTRVEAYGAFVEYLPGREGLVHVSRLTPDFVNSATDVVKVGDIVHVRIVEFKDDGRVGLSMLTAQQEAQARDKRNSGGGDRGDRSQGGNGGGRGGYNDRPRYDDRRGGGNRY